MKGLRILYKNSAGKRTLAAYHNPHSLTWRWVLSHQWRFGPWWRLDKLVMFWRDRHNFGGNAHLCVGPLALQYSWQRPTWYRDLYIRMREERDFSPPPEPRVIVRPEDKALH